MSPKMYSTRIYMLITFQTLSSSIDNFRSLIAICAGIRMSPQEMSQWSSRCKTRSSCLRFRSQSLRRAHLFKRVFSVKFSSVACMALLLINYELVNLKKPLTWLFLFAKYQNACERLSSLQNPQNYSNNSALFPCPKQMKSHREIW